MSREKLPYDKARGLEDFVAPDPPADRPGEDPEEGIRRLEETFRSWDEVRGRSSLRAPEQSPIRRAVGFLGRTARRVRDLGVSWELQRNLFQALIDRQGHLGRRLRVLEEMREKLAALEAEVAALQASEVNILGALDAMWALHAQQGADLGSGESRGEMTNLRDRHEILRVRQTRLEGALADLREELAALRGGPSASSLPLTPRDVAEILADLEKGTPEGERPGAVEISFQDARAEDLLLAARRHFGGRLASSGSTYRGPNDLWIHMDFTAWWSRPILLENAAARLQPGGRFVLVTAPGAGGARARPPQRAELVLAEDREVPLCSGGPVRVLVWVRA